MAAEYLAQEERAPDTGKSVTGTLPRLNAPRRPRVPRASPLIKRVGNTKADRVHLGVEVIRVLE
jgi:hypothetical protein